MTHAYANWTSDRCPVHGHPWNVAGLCSTVDCYRTATDPVSSETNWNAAPTAADIIRSIVESAEDYDLRLEAPSADAPADHVIVTTPGGRFYITAYRIAEEG